MQTTILKDKNPINQLLPQAFCSIFNALGNKSDASTINPPPTSVNSADGDIGTNASHMAPTPSSVHVQEMAYALLNGYIST